MMKLKIIKKLANWVSQESRMENELRDDCVKTYPKDSVIELELFEMFEKQPVSTIVVENDSRIKYANPGALGLTGYSSLNGIKLNKILCDRFGNKWLPDDNSCLQPSVKLLRHKNGRQFTVIVEPDSVRQINSKYKIYKLFAYSSLQQAANEQSSTSSTNSELPESHRIINETSSILNNEFGSNNLDIKWELGRTNSEFEKLESVFEGLPDALYILDLKGGIQSVNSRGCSNVNYKKEDLLGTNMSVLFQHSQQQTFKEKLQELKTDQAIAFDTVLKTSDGIEVPIELSICAKQITDAEVLVCHARNRISEKEDSNLNLKISNNEDEILAVFNASPVPMFVLNKKLEVSKINKAGLDEYAVSEEQLIQSELWKVIRCKAIIENKKICGLNKDCNNCDLYQLLNSVLKDNSNAIKKEITLYTNEGEKTKTRTVLASATIIPAGNEKELLLTLDDITERKKMEEEMIEARKKAEESDRLKTTFLNNLSHEIRTPLNGILGFSDLLLNSEKPQDIRRFAEIINHSGKLLLNVIDDLFTVSSLIAGTIKIEAQNIKLADLLEVTKIMLFEEHLSSEKNSTIKLSFKEPENLNGQLIHVDSSIFKVITKNLLRNAIKFTEQGYVEFGLAKSDEKENIFYIKDTGIGIEKDKQELIFQFFRQGTEGTTRMYGGAGTGLSISKSLLELMEGKIWLESTPEDGSTFFFSIPQKNSDSSDVLLIDERELITTDHSLKGKIILIVEDQINNFILLDEILTQEGADTVHASTGEEAIHFLENEKNIDLVLMDLKLPGISGFEATQRIKAISPDLPVIAQSAFVMPSDREKAMRSGCDDFLAKPLDASVLVQKITANL